MDRRNFLKGAGCLGLMSLADWRAFAADGGLPAYYGDYLAGIAAKVRTRAARGRDAFWFFTDPHVPANRKMSGRVLAKLVADTGVRKVICGGDIPEAFGSQREVEKAMTDFRRHWIDPVEAAGGRFYLAKGNHDFTIRESMKTTTGWTLDGRAASAYILGSRAAKSVVRNASDPECAYYYFDEPKAKIRYVVIDTTDAISPMRRYWSVETGVRTRQFAWLKDRAFGTLPKGWSAVVVNHIPLTTIVGDEGGAKSLANVRELLEAHASEIVMDLTGHMHREAQTHQKGVWHVTEPCDAAYADYIKGGLPWCPNLPRKNAGTVFENTFDAVIVGKDARIDFVRVGGGADRTLMRNARCVKVDETYRFTTSLGTVKWGSYDADRVTFKPDPENKWNRLVEYHADVATIDAQGVLTGRKPGESVVVALAPDGRKEMFPVRVEGVAKG